MDQESWRTLLLRLHAEGRSAELVQALSEASSSTLGKPVNGRDLSGIFLQGVKISGLELLHAVMNNANLNGAVLHDVQFYDIEAKRINLSHARVRGYLHGTFDHASFRSADLTRAALDGSFQSVDFHDANLKDVQFGLCSTYERADFTGARLSSSEEPSHLGIQGEGVSFRKARMIEADLSRLDMKIASFDEANLTRAILENAAFMPGEEESRSSFKGACLREVRGRNADFLWADMRGCDFTGADLRGARLEGCDLRGAVLEGTSLDDAYLLRARASATTRWPRGFDPASAGIEPDE